MARFIGNIFIPVRIQCLTGLHIGAGREKMEIGGVDLPVVRDPQNSYPYIPGSSLKGKMRSLLEYATGKVEDGSVHNCGRHDCPVCRVFGSSNEDRKCGPTRLAVPDAHPDASTVDLWQKTSTELLYTEVKSENFIDRITSAANPRFLERVIRGSSFVTVLRFSIFDMEDGFEDLKFLENVYEALRYLGDSSLGGHGSRGYGQISLSVAKPSVRTLAWYRGGKPGPVPSAEEHQEISALDVPQAIQMLRKDLAAVGREA